MSPLLRRLLFPVYVFFVNWSKQTEQDEDERPQETFIWKDAWFFLWNKFFWSFGRKTIAPYVKTVKPLVYEEWSSEEIADLERFQALAHRDAHNRDMHDKIFRSTRYALAPDTALALCRIYEHAMLAAPWHYGLEARKRAKNLVRNFFLFSLLVFIALCVVSAPPQSALLWLRFYSFFTTLALLSGWYASVRLYHLARETTRMRTKRNAPKL